MSPFLLMISLYYILVIDTDHDSFQLRKPKLNIWNLFYMDNGGIISCNPSYIAWGYSQLKQIFEPYKFKIQQRYSNCKTLRPNLEEVPPEANASVKLLGVKWNIDLDQNYYILLS